MAPDDLCLVGSRALFDEVEEKVAAVGPKILHGSMPADTLRKVRWQLAALSPVLVGDFALADVAARTGGRDRDDDLIIETALRGEATAIVSDDRRHGALDDEGNAELELGRDGSSFERRIGIVAHAPLTLAAPRPGETWPGSRGVTSTLCVAHRPEDTSRG